MLQDFDATNHGDELGRPAGGTADGPGMHIEWQNGPLGRDGDRARPNGAFVETVIAAAKQRIEYYETTEFSCPENRMALSYLNGALAELAQRTAAREARGVEGTHEV